MHAHDTQLRGTRAGWTWTHNNNFGFGGLSRKYSLYAPSSGSPTALVVLVHGSGMTETAFITETKAETTAQANNILLAAPVGVNLNGESGWNDEESPGGSLPDDVGFVDALVASLRGTYPSIPATKVYGYGMSNGGGLLARSARAPPVCPCS